MFDLSPYIDLPVIWMMLLSVAVLLYVLQDGFDLGLGILFLFAPDDRSRDRMMSSIAPFWDGNETWLVLGGGGLFAAFPLAYSVLMPAIYLPVITMLLALILRGVAFEFRFKSNRSRKLWNYVFHMGSLGATLMQGIILGTVVQGIQVENRQYAGGPFDWFTPFSIFVGVALVCGYMLLGLTWMVMKTTGEDRDWARSLARVLLPVVGLFMLLVCVAMPMLNLSVAERWFSMPNILLLSPIPLLTMCFMAMLWRDLITGARDVRPFVLTLGIFICGFVGLGVSIWPWIVPWQISMWDAAAAPESQSFLLIGTLVLLPLILGYVAYVYWVFRGKVVDDAHY